MNLKETNHHSAALAFRMSLLVLICPPGRQWCTRLEFVSLPSCILRLVSEHAGAVGLGLPLTVPLVGCTKCTN
ncbi:hypothetical protein THAOC_15572 [Thalassiosira oceanica]|uniref:Secreted protein n=1 Tax=Thalassiosira oceanica TaxID=159749 RepID=K0SFJ8_THAOC|nr:hypothetical protein THAOC_15572 [Thalassiosira oceanica]|eukprot:EJK63754.1 hypothetical protein THAOC_15572 [Thalassiosira oceanica]